MHLRIYNRRWNHHYTGETKPVTPRSEVGFITKCSSARDIKSPLTTTSEVDIANANAHSFYSGRFEKYKAGTPVSVYIARTSATRSSSHVAPVTDQ